MVSYVIHELFRFVYVEKCDRIEFQKNNIHKTLLSFVWHSIVDVVCIRKKTNSFLILLCLFTTFFSSRKTLCSQDFYLNLSIFTFYTFNR